MFKDTVNIQVIMHMRGNQTKQNKETKVLKIFVSYTFVYDKTSILSFFTSFFLTRFPLLYGKNQSQVFFEGETCLTAAWHNRQTKLTYSSMITAMQTQRRGVT